MRTKTTNNNLFLINWFEQQLPSINYVYVKNGQNIEKLSEFIKRKNMIIVSGHQVDDSLECADNLIYDEEWFAVVESDVLDFIYNNIVTISEDLDELSLIVSANSEKVSEKRALELAESIKSELGVAIMPVEFIDEPDYEMLEVIEDKAMLANIVDAYTQIVTKKGKQPKPTQPKIIEYPTTVNVNTKVNDKAIALKIEQQKKAIVATIESKIESIRNSIYKSPKANTILYDIKTSKDAIIPDKNGINLVFAKDGVYEIVHGGFGIFAVKNSEINLPNSIPLKNFDFKDIWFIPKPDEEILNRLIELDRYVYKKTKAEFYANVIWDYEKEAYEIDIPKQIISGATVEFEEFINTKTRIKVIDHHSHNIMSSFFSGTDDANDVSRFKLSIVIGNLSNNDFSVSARKVVAGLFQNVDYHQIFDIDSNKYVEDLKRVDALFRNNTISTNTYSTQRIKF